MTKNILAQSDSSIIKPSTNLKEQAEPINMESMHF